MKDILLQHDDGYIECDINGLTLTYTYSDDPKRHYVLTLRNENSYDGLKKQVNKEYNIYENKEDGYTAVNDFLQSRGVDEFCIPQGYTYCDLRSREEIYEYEDEAFDKVWLMRSCDISKKEPVYEAGREGVKRIFETYDDIPEDGYTTWECGYWNGILAALRWVLGDEKNFLDT